MKNLFFALIALHVAPFVSAAQSTPPNFEVGHLPWGCFVESSAYVARFTEMNPSENARLFSFTMKHDDGRLEPHTIALVSWNGRLWGRDGYFGLFDTGISASDSTDSVIESAVKDSLKKHSIRLIKQHQIAKPKKASMTPSAKARMDAVRAAAEMIPGSTVYFMGNANRPVLVWHPAPGQIATYDPARGTACGETKLVGDAAARLMARTWGFDGVARPAATATVAGL